MNQKVCILIFVLFISHYLVAQNDTIHANKKVLVQSDLNIIANLTENDSTTYYNEDVPLTKYLSFELIDQKLYTAKKKKAVSFLIADTLVHKKKNGIITIPCQKKTVKFVDKLEAEEDIQLYYYIGKINILNSFLVLGTYWEEYDYKLIDKITGEVKLSFLDYPFISGDKKNIICIHANPYESTADLEFYTIDKNKIKRIISACFKNWMPAGEKNDTFWSSDGYLYLPVIHNKAYWSQDGDLNKNFQYVRIKIK
jgi:hypothetical protein